MGHCMRSSLDGCRFSFDISPNCHTKRKERARQKVRPAGAWVVGAMGEGGQLVLYSLRVAVLMFGSCHPASCACVSLVCVFGWWVVSHEFKHTAQLQDGDIRCLCTQLMLSPAVQAAMIP